MHFQIEDRKADLGEGKYRFAWHLVKADGEVLCGKGPFESEREARSHIAKVKKSMAGATRYKVRSPE